MTFVVLAVVAAVAESAFFSLVEFSNPSLRVPLKCGNDLTLSLNSNSPIYQLGLI